LSTSPTPNFSSGARTGNNTFPQGEEYDWRISDKQYRMISDKARHLSKKEASLLINFMEHCIFNIRPKEREKQQKQETLNDNA
jgi:hypothetical protein